MKKFLSGLLIFAAMATPCFIDSFGSAYAQKSHSSSRHSSSKSKSSSSSSSSNSNVVGSFTVNGLTVTLLKSGKLKTSDKCLVGTYDKLLNGAYTLYFTSAPNASCGDYASTDLLVGNDLYNIMEGTEFTVTNFVYDPETGLVTILEMDGMPASDADCRDAGLPSSQPQLSFFKKKGTVKWNGSNTANSAASIDKSLVEYSKLVNEAYEEFYYEGEFEEPMGSGWAALAPVIKKHASLLEMKGSMTDEQKALFDKLSNKIKEILNQD